MMRRFAIYLYGPDGGPLESRFSEAAERLEAIERLFFEPDGSFVWRDAGGREAWQVDGMIYDRAEQIQYVDLKGSCPLEAWRRLLAVFAGSGDSGGLSILSLPERRRMGRDRFEEEIWGNPAQPKSLA